MLDHVHEAFGLTCCVLLFLQNFRGGVRRFCLKPHTPVSTIYMPNLGDVQYHDSQSVAPSYYGNMVSTFALRGVASSSSLSTSMRF